jgi:transcriptional repressor NrdR
MVPLVVIKRDGSHEPFKREKLLSGVLTACKKRPISLDAIEGLVRDVESKLMDDYNREIPFEKIGEMVMNSLHDLDSVAYVRFASVYRQFKDAGEFVKEIKQIR